MTNYNFWVEKLVFEDCLYFILTLGGAVMRLFVIFYDFLLKRTIFVELNTELNTIYTYFINFFIATTKLISLALLKNKQIVSQKREFCFKLIFFSFFL